MGLAPTAAPNAATIFTDGGPPALQQIPQQHPQLPQHQAGAFNIGPQPQPNQAAFMQTGVASGQPGMGIMGPPGSFAHAAPSPYQASPRAPRPLSQGRPVEPWRRALPLLMIIWGVATLVAWAAPVSIDPLRFPWDGLIEAPGSLKIATLLPAAIGLLGIVLGSIPMAVTPRGALATILGAAGTVVPLAIVGEVPPWQLVAPMIGLALLVPGLVVRSQYVESLLSRLLVTFGVIAVVLPFVVPAHGEIHLVAMAKGLIDGHMHGMEIVLFASVIFALLNLLVWLPGPSTAASGLFAWVWMLAPLILFGFMLGDPLEAVVAMAKASPRELLQWVPTSASLVFFGYGLASVFGKQLE